MYRINEETCVQMAEIFRIKEPFLGEDKILGEEFPNILRNLPSNSSSSHIYDAEPLYDVSSHERYRCEINIEKQNVIQGKNALRLDVTNASVDDSGWGLIAFVDFSSPLNLTNYDYFMFYLYIPEELENMNGGGFDINFISQQGKEDGFTYRVYLANKSAGWYAFKFRRDSLAKKDANASWDNIVRLRLAWLNGKRRSSGYFLFDNLVAYN